MAYRGAKHNPRKINRAAGRLNGRMGRRIGLQAMVSRNGRTGEFSAAVCLRRPKTDAWVTAPRKGGHRCASNSGATPTAALKGALKKLASTLK